MANKTLSGIGHMTLELVRALDDICTEYGVEIVLVTCSDRSRYIEDYNLKNGTIKRLPIPTRVFNLLWKYDLLPRMDRFLGNGVYVFPNYKNWRLKNANSMTFICDIVYKLHPEFVQPKNLEFLSKNVNRWINRTDKVLTISKSAYEEITEELGVAKEKMGLVSCGVDRSVFYPRPKSEVLKFLHEYNLPSNYILYLGNIEPRKNIEGLIKAYERLPANLQRKHPLVLVGGGGWLNESILVLIDEARQRGVAIIKPDRFIPDDLLPVLHSGASLLVHPAHYEGFGISPLQAMACATPVVAANNSSIPEVVGDAALLFDSRNIEEISDRMNSVLSDKKLSTRLTEKGLVQATRYSWTAAAKVLIREAVDSDGK